MSEKLLHTTMTKFTPEITGTQKAVLIYMCMFASEEENKYLCAASVPTITYHSKINERTVQAARAKLRELDYIKIHRDDPGHGRVYKINHKKIEKLKDAKITTSICYEEKMRLRVTKKSSNELRINPPERQRKPKPEKQEELVLESKELQNLRIELASLEKEKSQANDRRKRNKIKHKIKEVERKIKSEEQRNA